jgi:hypothetical protein
MLARLLAVGPRRLSCASKVGNRLRRDQQHGARERGQPDGDARLRLL